MIKYSKQDLEGTGFGHLHLVEKVFRIIGLLKEINKSEFLNKAIGPAVEKVMEDRKPILINDPGTHPSCKNCPIIEGEEEDTCKYTAEVIAPIIAEGDPIGAVILLSKEDGTQMGDMELKLAETAAGFLAKQMEP